MDSVSTVRDGRGRRRLRSGVRWLSATCPAAAVLFQDPLSWGIIQPVSLEKGSLLFKEEWHVEAVRAQASVWVDVRQGRRG